MSQPPASDQPALICPICRGETRPFCRRHANGREWQIDQCRSCGHGFVSNRPTLDELAAIYSSDDEEPPEMPLDEDELRNKRDCIDLARCIADLTDERGATLDVGCGGGGFSYHLAKLGFTPNVLNDFSPASARVIKYLSEAEFHQGAFEDLKHRGPFSVIVMSQVLEHTLDPADWLLRSRRLLSPNGVLAIAVPNFAGLYHLFGTRDPFIIPPRHLNYFTPRSLRMAMEQAGLRVIKMDSRSRIKVSGHFRPHGIAVRRALAGCWNLASGVLNPTTRGVILRAYARPKP
jgi:2-polyprenyl-3-methyl-5-hydroxy-6-metoxy-1,4-benzoquinol methylase